VKAESVEVGNEQSLLRNDETEIDKIFASAWQIAARRNPMFLASFSPDTALRRLREFVKARLTEGVSSADACELLANELLRPEKIDTPRKESHHAGG
jgi:hypothetical protein